MSGFLAQLFNSQYGSNNGGGNMILYSFPVQLLSLEEIINTEPIKSHQINDFCDHNKDLTKYYENKLYCDECIPKDIEDPSKVIKIYLNDSKCGICFEETFLDIIYDCGHMFCQECVNNLEKTSNKCPICHV
jgi:hypothetical protein